jgi:hypothetical protein
LLAALGAGLGLAEAAVGEEPAAGPEPEAQAERSTPPVSLDRLLQLPSGSDYGVERRAGLTRGEWRSRFVRIDTALEQEERGLKAAQAEQDRLAGSADQWLLGPPGTTRSDAPLDYQLRKEIDRHKDEIERLKRTRKDLDVEANLAGVPKEWRE